MTNTALVYYAVGACCALGATMLYALVLILAALLVRETRDFYKLITSRRKHGLDNQDSERE